MNTNTNTTLINALNEAQAGLEFAAARMPQTCGFVPSHIAALKIVNEALSTAAQPPAGWVMVPLEPTHVQAKAAADAWLDCGSRLVLNKALAAVRAGIAAAPHVQIPQENVHEQGDVSKEAEKVDTPGVFSKEALAEALGHIQLDEPAQPDSAAVAGPVMYVSARECSECKHVGINDDHETNAACNDCGWSGPSPIEDRCPGCEKGGTMTAACPKCSGSYRLLDEETIATPTTQAPQQEPIAVVTRFHDLGGEIDWTGRAIAQVGAKLCLAPQPGQSLGADVDAILRDLKQLASEVCDHTPDSFQRGVVRLANRAHALATQAKEGKP